MPSRYLCHAVRGLLLVLSCFPAISTGQTQELARAHPDRAHRHVKERNAWFFRGRIVAGKPSAELRRRAHQVKMQMRARRAAVTAGINSPSVGAWMPLGPAPLASDASGTGVQDYRQVAGRTTAVVIDPADPTGNTVYVGGAQGGIWKANNAANSDALAVTWTAIADDQATLSIGSIAIQPGNSDPAQTLILAGTGEANNSADSYYGLGILRSTDAGNTWTLISTANGGALSFSGLGGTRMAFSTPTTVVSAMATTSEGLNDGAVTASTTRGLYTSLDAGLNWIYNAVLDPGSQPTDATSATSVVYNSGAGLFFAAVRFHGFYSSPDGTNWTRLANQPGNALLSAAACPAQSTSNNRACPIYRGEISVVAGRNEMYAWFISLDSAGDSINGGIWQSLDAGSTWTPITDTGITNCGDIDGCGVERGDYNLELAAIPNSSGTDLYAGAINLYKCAINVNDPQCGSAGFMNLTHAYGCSPIASPAHVHPSQHALDFMIPSAGADSGGALLYFANDGGVYRALNGFSGLNTGSCSGANQFDDLNQNLGSLTQFVSFSQHPTDSGTVLGGAQANGSPATASATTSTSWQAVNGGDGGFNAIDSNAPLNWFVSNADIAPGGLNIQQCSNGINCRESDFTAVVASNQVGGDDGAFYSPYILDPQSPTALLVGTCRVWRGSRLGGAYTVLSPNFDTFGSGTCTGSEINVVRALAAGGPIDNNGSKVIYATTDGSGPLTATSPTGGHVWATSDATSGATAFTDVTQNINPNQFPISSVAIDALDSTGNTAYVAIMGFTGGPGHVWKTIDGGATWADFTGSVSPLPDAPVNALLVDASTSMIYAGTDVGVFQSSTGSAGWTELGPAPASGQHGFLPNVAVTALGLFSSSTQKLLRASTYGRGIWQFNLNLTPDFQITIPDAEQAVFLGQIPVFTGTASAVNGYADSVSLICVRGTTNPPDSCAANPAVITPSDVPSFAFTADSVIGDYNFFAQADGLDAQNTTHRILLTLHVIDFGMTTPSPGTVTVLRGTSSSPVNFLVTAAGSFSQSVTVSCSVNIAGATCNLTPGEIVNPTSTSPISMAASVSVPFTAPPGSYAVSLQADTAGASSPPTTSFTLNVTLNPDFILSAPLAFPLVRAGSTNTGASMNLASRDGFASTVNLACSLDSLNGSCSVSPASVNSFPASPNVTVNAASLGAGSYQMSVQGTSGATAHGLAIPFNVGDYQLSGTQSLTLAPGSQGTANFTITPSTFYSGQVNANCDASALAGAICTLAPVNPVTVSAGTAVPLTATINVPNDAAPGGYSITINTQDTTGNPTHNLTVQLTISQDYTIGNLTPSSQTVSVGQSASYNFNVIPLGAAYSNPITLKCIVAPVFLGKCTFSPNPVPPLGNSTAASVVMTVSTQAATGRLVFPRPGSSPRFYVAWLALPAIVIWCAGRRGGRRKSAVFVVLTLAVMLLLPSCGGGSNGGGGGGGGNGTHPGTYIITVTGAPASTNQTVPPSATLTVN